jgi:hypothetical protein
VEEAPVDGGQRRNAVPVGDWVIADRVLLARGEYVSQSIKVDLPIWKFSIDKFVLPAIKEWRTAHEEPHTGIFVEFGHDEGEERESILVDIEGGQKAYQRTTPPRRIEDTARREVLMLSPEGKLLARNSAVDEPSLERKTRRERWRSQIKALKSP